MFQDKRAFLTHAKKTINIIQKHPRQVPGAFGFTNLLSWLVTFYVTYLCDFIQGSLRDVSSYESLLAGLTMLLYPESLFV